MRAIKYKISSTIGILITILPLHPIMRLWFVRFRQCNYSLVHLYKFAKMDWVKLRVGSFRDSPHLRLKSHPNFIHETITPRDSFQPATFTMVSPWTTPIKLVLWFHQIQPMTTPLRSSQRHHVFNSPTAYVSATAAFSQWTHGLMTSIVAG